ncbi:MAG: efflux RND transporter periplasmic adaptor subunit [Colwellia sp.]|nr:efflux RND transporter periplasmic adaptor subunit [Colwellia sp.]
MLIVLGLYFLIIWAIFFKFKVLPWNKGWKITCYGIALAIALVVIGALNFYVPSSISAVVQSQSQRIYPQVMGQVETVNDNKGLLRKGDILVTLDATPFELIVASSKASLDLSKIKYADAQTLVEKGVEREKSLDIYKVELKIAQSLYDKATYDLDNTVIRAPFDGKIIAAALTPGQTVGRTNPVLTMQKSGEQWLAVVIGQTGMSNIEVGDEVGIVFSSSPGDIYQSKVASISSGLIQGQVFAEDRQRPLDNILAARPVYGLTVIMPENVPEHIKREGTTAAVTVFTDKDNPLNILGKIIQWIGSLIAYL